MKIFESFGNFQKYNFLKVDVVREVSDEGIKQLKFQHEQEIIQIRKRHDANVKRIKVSSFFLEYF